MSEPEIDPRDPSAALAALFDLSEAQEADLRRAIRAYAAEREAKLREMLTNAQEAAVTLGAEVAKLREERDAALALAEERAALLTTECALASRYMAERDAAIKAREAAEVKLSEGHDETCATERYRLRERVRDWEAAHQSQKERGDYLESEAACLLERAEKAEAALRSLLILLKQVSDPWRQLADLRPEITAILRAQDAAEAALPEPKEPTR